MKIKEAIQHCRKVAAGATAQGKCPECAADHAQLADWLEELVRYRDTMVTPEELAVIAPATMESVRDFSLRSRDDLETFCRIHKRTQEILQNRIDAARAVVDIVAKTVGIDPEDTSFDLYWPNTEGTSPIADKIEEFISRGGDKARLKRRVDELEKENAVLRSLLQK